MIILLTGLPRTGKTTVLNRFLKAHQNDCDWIVSHEIRNAADERVGFEASTSSGDRGIFAHKEHIQSEWEMGGYRVDLHVIDRLFAQTISDSMAQLTRLLVLDEIGRMQMMSPRFVDVIDRQFQSDKFVLATIRHGDEWAEVYKQNPRAQVIEVTLENRERLPEMLEELLGLV